MFLEILEAPDVSESQKSHCINNAIIPLFSARYCTINVSLIHIILYIISIHPPPFRSITSSCNNPSLDRSATFTSSFIYHYVHLLDSLLTNSTILSLSPDYIVAILRLNTLLVQYLYGLLQQTTVQYEQDLNAKSCKSILHSFATTVYGSGTVKGVVTAYSLLYLGQEAVTCGSADDAMRLYLNSIHLYNNSHIDVIYQAAQILAKCRKTMRYLELQQYTWFYI